jgi:hypothetical protein
MGAARAFGFQTPTVPPDLCEAFTINYFTALRWLGSTPPRRRIPWLSAPLSSFFSCLLLHRLLASPYTELTEGARRGNVPTNPLTPLLSLTMFTRRFYHLGCGLHLRFLRPDGLLLGLLLNCDKCSILLSTTGSAFFHTFPSATVYKRT